MVPFQNPKYSQISFLNQTSKGLLGGTFLSRPYMGFSANPRFAPESREPRRVFWPKAPTCIDKRKVMFCIVFSHAQFVYHSCSEQVYWVQFDFKLVLDCLLEIRLSMSWLRFKDNLLLGKELNAICVHRDTKAVEWFRFDWFIYRASMIMKKYGTIVSSFSSSFVWLAVCDLARRQGGHNLILQGVIWKQESVRIVTRWRPELFGKQLYSAWSTKCSSPVERREAGGENPEKETGPGTEAELSLYLLTLTRHPKLLGR